MQAPYLALNKAKQMIEPYRVLKNTVELPSPEQEKMPLFGVLNHEE